MTERITHRDVRDTASWEERNHPGCSGSWLFDLADQMEADAAILQMTVGDLHGEALRCLSLEVERDTLAAKVRELVSIAEALYPLVESDPQLCNHPVVERLRRVLSGKEAPTC